MIIISAENGLPISSEDSRIIGIESRIDRISQVKYQIKVLQAEEAALKKNLIDEHFYCNDEYIDSNNVVLATYKEELYTIFKTELFKKDEASLYAKYSDAGIRRKFIVK